MTVSPGYDLTPEVVSPRPRVDARRTLVCLGFCGGGVAPYLPWVNVLGPETELAAVCYPGRDGRYSEAFAQSWDEQAADATRAVARVAARRPYVLFGHSTGGWMAFDVAVRIEEQGGPLPIAIVVSNANAPGEHLRPYDMRPTQQADDRSLLEWMRDFGKIPGHVLADPDLREMALEVMRADMRVRDTFRYQVGRTTGVPLQVLQGADDHIIEPDMALRWRALARNDYRHDVLPGGHFYTPSVWAALPHRISDLGNAPSQERGKESSD